MSIYQWHFPPCEIKCFHWWLFDNACIVRLLSHKIRFYLIDFNKCVNMCIYVTLSTLFHKAYISELSCRSPSLNPARITPIIAAQYPIEFFNLINFTFSNILIYIFVKMKDEFQFLIRLSDAASLWVHWLTLFERVYWRRCIVRSAHRFCAPVLRTGSAHRFCAPVLRTSSAHNNGGPQI